MEPKNGKVLKSDSLLRFFFHASLFFPTENKYHKITNKITNKKNKRKKRYVISVNSLNIPCLIKSFIVSVLVIKLHVAMLLFLLFSLVQNSRSFRWARDGAGKQWEYTSSYPMMIITEWSLLLFCAYFNGV